MTNLTAKERPLKPVLKWAGGKGQLLDELRRRYPTQLGQTITKYAEPFVGGGAVLFDVLSHYDLERVYISDTNSELINAYTILRDNSELLIDALHQYATDYLPLEDSSRKDYFYAKRTRFNELKLSNQRGVELAALFVFLNRTCFNGLYRVNSQGAYNVPMGKYKSPTICDEDNLRRVARALQGTIIECAPYSQAEAFIDAHTFAYFDPPYRPLSVTSSFTAYTENDFNDTCQTELSQFIKAMGQRGAYVLASNSDPRNTNPDDDFFDDLYAGLTIERISANRMINSKASARGAISEILVSNRRERKAQPTRKP